MKTVVKLSLLSFFLFIFVCNSFCQDNYASNVRTTVSAEQKLFINYDIVVNDSSKYFNVIIQLIYEGQPIKTNQNNLYGDYGSGMTPGNKIIFWNYAGDFSEDINKVEVKVFAYKERD